MTDELETNAEWAHRFWGMSLEEMDRVYIQKPVDQLNVTVTRWTRLPFVAFRKLPDGEYPAGGSYEQLTYPAFEHGPSVMLAVGDPRNTRPRYCEHIPGAYYPVDPDAPDRIDLFRKMWTLPVPA